MSVLPVLVGLTLVLMTGLQAFATQPNSLLAGQSQPSSAQPAQGNDWTIEIVDSGWRICGAFLALDSEDNPHISYINETEIGGKIVYALKYAKRIGGSWSSGYVDTSGASHHSLAIDSNDYPHIAYHAETETWGGLRYAKWTGSTWDNEIVDSGSSLQRPSIAIDSNDDPHISYWDGYNHQIKYAIRAGGSWTIEVLDPSDIFVGPDNSLALDSNDYPHVAYYDPLDLSYARWTGSWWNIEIVDSDGDTGDGNSIALDSNDYPHISYSNESSDHDLKYARWTGSSWEIRFVAPGSARMTHLALDSNDYPQIGYQHEGYQTAWPTYAKWTGSEWKIESIEDGYGSGFALDSNDNPHMAYCDIPLENIKYAYKISEPPSRSLNLNIDPDTLNLKSRGRWITAYLTTENAKAEDIDASSLLLNDVVRPDWWDVQNDTTLMVKFNRSAVQAILPVSVAIDMKVTGQWKDGETFELHDIIRVIQPGRVPLGPASVPTPRELLMNAQRDFERACPHMSNVFQSVGKPAIPTTEQSPFSSSPRESLKGP